MAQDHLFAEILNAFAQLEKYIPGCGTWPVDLMIGKLPEANPADIYRLADAWGAAAERLNTYYYDALHSADPINQNWQGDGAPMAFSMAWNNHLQDVGQVIQGMTSMQIVVQSYGLELETEEFFIAFMLIMLLVQAIIAVVSAFFTGGISLGQLGLAYTAARTAIKAAFEKCLQAILRLGEMIAEGEVRRILGRTAVKDFLLTAGKDLARHSGAALAKAPEVLAKAPGALAKVPGAAGRYALNNLGPRRLLAKAAGERAAAQFRKDVLRSVLRKELRKQLANVSTKAEARAAVRALDRATADLSRRVAQDVSQRLLAKWTGRTAASLGRHELARLGEHEAFNVAERYGQHALADAGRSMLDRFVARELERTTMLGTAGRYVGQLAFAGARFMGGVDFLAQGFEVVTGERSSIDVNEVAMSLGQGALMGGLMFGHGVLGKMVTGGFAGVTTAAATDGVQLLTNTITGQHSDIDWGGDLWRGARDGVRMGLVFSAPQALAGAASKFVPHFGERPGTQTFALNDTRLGSNVWTGDPRTGAGGYASESGGVGWRLADGSFVHLGPDGTLIASHRAVPAEAGPVAHTRADGPPGSTALVDRPADRALGSGGGNDQGGPPRTRVIEGSSTRTGERALPPGREAPGNSGPPRAIPEQRAPEPGTGPHEPGTDHQPARTDQTRTGTDHEPARTDQTRTGTDHEPARTDQTRTDHEPARTDQTRTDHEPARTDHARTDTDHQPARTDQTRTDTGHEPVRTDHTRTETDPQPVGTDHTRTGTDHQPARTDQQRTDSSPAERVEHDRTGTGPRVVDDAPRTDHTDPAAPRDTTGPHEPAREQERPRTEIPADQAVVRQPQGEQGMPAGRTHAEEVRAGFGDRHAPETLRAEQDAHLGRPDTGRPTHALDRIEQRLDHLAAEGRAATAAEPHPGPRPAEVGPAGAHWVNAAGGHTADPHAFPRRLFADVLNSRVPGGLAGADPHVVRAHARDLAERVLSGVRPEDKVDVARRLRDYVAAEMSVAEGTGRRLDPARLERVADAAAERAQAQHRPERAEPRPAQREQDGHAPRDTRTEQDGHAPRDTRTEQDGHVPRDTRTEQDHAHDPRGEHDGIDRFEAPVGHEPVRIAPVEPPTHEVHRFTRRFMQMSTDGSRRWQLVTDHVERHWTEATYERLPVEHMEGGADGPAARQAAHRAAHDLAQREYTRVTEATDRWLSGEGRIEDVGTVGGMSAAAVLRDGRVVAATSVRERTTRVVVDSGHDDASWQRLNRHERAEVMGDYTATRRAALAAEEGLHPEHGTHPLVRQELAAITNGLRSQTHGRCAEPATLSRVARMVEADLRSEIAARGGEPRPGSDAYNRQLTERFRETVRDGYMASHRNEGEPIDRSEQLPCSTDDQLLNQLRMRSDYVDQAIATAHVDPQRRLVVLVEPGDRLRDYGMRLPDLGPDTVVVVMHGNVEGGTVGARIGDRDVTGVEVARVLNRIIDQHPQELGGRRIVLVTCEAGAEGMVRGRNTSLALEVTARTGQTVIAATRDVMVSEHGEVRVEPRHLDDAVEDLPRSRPQPEPSGWVETTPVRDRSGLVTGARAEPLPHDQVPFAGEHRPDGHQVRANEPVPHDPGRAAPNTIEGTRYVPDGRSYGRLVELEVLAAGAEPHPGDFGGRVRAIEQEGFVLRVEDSRGNPHYFRVEIGHDMRDVSTTAAHTGTASDPHVVTVNSGVHSDLLPRVWLNEITRTLDAAPSHWPSSGPQHGLTEHLAGASGHGEHGPRPGMHGGHDPAAEGLLAQRRHLMRQLADPHQSWQAEDLRNDLHGVDRALAERGYDTRPLEPVPEPPRGPEHDTHDEVWTERRWEREGRPPSADELIPQTQAEATRWSGAMAEAVQGIFEGHRFGGFEIRPARTDPISAWGNELHVRLEVVGADGHFSFTLRRLDNGHIDVHHDSVGISDHLHGQGFYRQLNQHLEHWYRQSGVDHVGLRAASTTGGYVHAREGVDWDPASPGSSRHVLNRLEAEVSRLSFEARVVRQYLAGDRSVHVGGLVHEYRQTDPYRLLNEIERQHAEGQHLLDRAERHPFGSAGHPTPREIADAGRPLHGDTGRDRMWLGKRTLLGADWRGVKHMSHEGPQHTRGGEQVTAASVPRSPTFHGYARDVPAPAEVAGAGRTALAGALDRHPVDGPLRNARIELTSVSPERPGWPGDAVARSIPLDAAGRDLSHGTVPPEGGGYRIELSDRAADRAVERAVVHEVAETGEILARERAGEPHDVPDALRPGDFTPDARLSPHDVGRLAERALLQEQAADTSTSRAERREAREELELLDEHLGLHGTDDATMARRALVDAHEPRVEPGTAVRPHRLEAPFRFREMYADQHWHADATAFEQRVGAHFFNDARTVDTVRGAVTRLHEVLTDLAVAAEPGQSRDVLARRVERAFFRDDAPDSAGQVGSHVRLAELVEHGNLRELMTGFYNAAYFNRASPDTLAHALNEVFHNDRFELAREAGADVAGLRAVDRQLQSPLRRAAERVMPYQFGEDTFGTGNVALRSSHPGHDLAELTRSQRARVDRNPADQERLGLIHTAEHYERLGVPLGRLERAYVESRTEGPFTDQTPLPWREGLTSHDTTDSRWARSVTRRGLLAVDGVSGTTARMLTAAKLIGLDHAQTERFLDGLMGWMLPGRDHSMFEIIRGAEVARVVVRTERFEPAHMYRELARVEPAVLRAEVAPAGLVPHETGYHAHAVDPAGFSETQHKVQDIAGHLWPQLRSGHVTDPMLEHWLRENGIDPADPAAVSRLADHLTEPHVMALAVYTRHSHYLINNVVRSEMFTHSDRVVGLEFNRKVDQLVRNYLEKLAVGQERPLPLPLALRPVVHSAPGHLTSESPLGPTAQRWVDARQEQLVWKQQEAALREQGRIVEATEAGLRAADADRVRRAAAQELKADLRATGPQLLREMRWHADMVHDAMMQLPVVGHPDRPVLVYRGDWRTPIHSPIYGSALSPHGQAREFLSTSRQLEVAVRFMGENPAAGQKVLVVFKLVGHYGRDISVFSSFNTDGEVVLPPGSRMVRVDDAALADSVRSQLPVIWQDRTEIIVMTEN